MNFLYAILFGIIGFLIGFYWDLLINFREYTINKLSKLKGGKSKNEK